MVKIVRFNQIATHSDGLGDAVHVCHFRGANSTVVILVGGWSDQPLLATVPIGVMVELWTRHTVRRGWRDPHYSQSLKHHYERLLRAQYSRIVMRLAAKAALFLGILDY